MLYRKDAPCALYRDVGDKKYTPWTLCLGSKKIAGYKAEMQTGTCLAFEKTYNDRAEVSIAGAQYPLNLISCGKNLWDGTSESGTLNADTGLPQASGSLRRTLFIPVAANALYKVQRTVNSGTYWGFFAYNGNQQFISRSGQTVAARVAWTTPANTRFLRFIFHGTGDSQIALYRIRAEQANILEDYEPYEGHTIAVNSGENFIIPTLFPLTNIFTDAIPPLTLNCTARVTDL